MKRFSASVLFALAFICASFVCALTGLQLVFCDADRYTALHDEFNVYPYVGIDREEQVLINGDLAGYLSGKTDSLAREVTLLGEKVSCPFNERELSHMEDVRRLFDLGFAARRWALFASVVLFASALLLRKRGAWKRGLLLAAALTLAAGLTVFLLLRTVDFSNLFYRFHELVFTNDLWLLDPATDAMIRMLPEAFFERMALTGAFFAAIGWLIPFIAGGPLALLSVKHRFPYSGGQK